MSNARKRQPPALGAMGAAAGYTLDIVYLVEPEVVRRNQGPHPADSVEEMREAHSPGGYDRAGSIGTVGGAAAVNTSTT